MKYNSKLPVFLLILMTFFAFLSLGKLVSAQTQETQKLEKAEFINFKFKPPDGSDWQPVNRTQQSVALYNGRKNMSITVGYNYFPLLEEEWIPEEKFAEFWRKRMLNIVSNQPGAVILKDSIEFSEETISNRKFYATEFSGTINGEEMYNKNSFTVDGNTGFLEFAGTVISKDERKYEFLSILKEMIESTEIIEPDEFLDLQNRALIGINQFTQAILSKQPELLEKAKKMRPLLLGQVNRCLELNPNNSLSHYQLAYLNEYNEECEFHGEGCDLEFVESEFKKAIESNPKEATLYFYQADFYNKLDNRTEDMIASLNKAVELDPAQSLYALTLAGFYLKEGQKEEAIRVMGIALDHWTGDKEGKKQIKDKIKELKNEIDGE